MTTELYYITGDRAPNCKVSAKTWRICRYWGTAGVRRSWDYPLTRAYWAAGNMVQHPPPPPCISLLGASEICSVVPADSHWSDSRATFGAFLMLSNVIVILAAHLTIYLCITLRFYISMIEDLCVTITNIVASSFLQNNKQNRHRLNIAETATYFCHQWV